MNIPLLRPSMPDIEDYRKYLYLSKSTNTYSNFGPCYNLACEKLKRVYPSKVPLLTNNGTSSLQAALMSLGLRPGSTIAIPDFTFAATAQAVLNCNFNITVIPTSTETWAIDELYLYANPSKYDAFIVVYPFGYWIDEEKFDKVSREMKKPVVYDAAAAWGQEFKTKNPVSISLHATKNLPIGEGGLVLFDKDDTKGYDIAKSYISFGFDDNKIPVRQGINGKIDELHCAVLNAQLDRRGEIDKSITEKEALLYTYMSELSNLRLELPIHSGGYRKYTPQLCVFKTKKLKEIENWGQENNVTFRRYYLPLISDTEIPLKNILVGLDYEYFDNIIAFPANPTTEELAFITEGLSKL